MTITAHAFAPRPTVWARPVARAGHLAVTRVAAQLMDELDDLPERGRAERFALRQEATARVHRPGAAERDDTVGEQPGLLARLAQAELVVREQLPGRVGVLALDDVDVVGTHARFLVGVACRERRRRCDVGVIDAGERCRFAEHAAGEVGTQPRRRERHRGAGRAVGGAAQHDRGRTFVGRAQHPEVQRRADEPRREHFFGGHLLAEHRVRVVHAVPPILDDDPREVVLRQSVLAQQALRAQREVRRCGRESRFLAPRFEEGRADDALRHLLDAEHQHAVVLPGPDRARRELEGGTAARAARLDVDDRHARARDRAEDLVTGRDAAVRGAAERGLERRIAGLGERGAHRVHTHVGVRQRVEASEGMDADTGDLDAGHDPAAAGVNAHVTTPSWSSSATRVIGWPNCSRAGSDSVSRVTTRSCSRVSSTTPKPYGVGPS